MENRHPYNDAFRQFVQDHLHDDPAHLLLSRKPGPEFDLKAAVHQIAMRQKAAGKLPAFCREPGLIFPPSLSLEQSSSEMTAIFKKQLVAGKTFIDLTGGFGVDTYFMGRAFEKITYVEQQEELVNIALHNFPLLFEANTYTIIHGDGLNYLAARSANYDCLFVDPARRGRGDQKLYKLQDCEPDVVSNWALLQQKARQILIKASPMLDLSMAKTEIPDIQEMHILSVKNEVREVLLLYKSNLPATSTRIFAHELDPTGTHTFDFTFEEESAAQPRIEGPFGYLILPPAAVLKAGAFKTFALRHGLAKLHPHTHLYTCGDLPADIPGRIFQVMGEIKLNRKTIQTAFPDGKVNVLVRNHPLNAAELKSRYRLKDGGEDYLIACTPADGRPRAYWCKRIK
ncbi:THUMP-like domain-containing protein [Negadavirga shengliensis]|uniref:Class I SAM-dependent methyltransferase n=1 Tax=Negadavirga shengliensis TaxID=1389218 RepID=A0ABV9SVC6_9BACT